MSQLPEPMVRFHDLATAAEAIAAASAAPGPIYVERRGDLYRWSLTHRGGPYPLLRETAKLLGIDYHQLVVPCRALDGTGLTIVTAEPHAGPPDAWMLLDPSPAASPDSVTRSIREHLDVQTSGW